MADMPRVFTASAEVRLASPERLMLRLCAHFREFGEVMVNGPCSRVETGFGTAGMEACKGCLKISAQGKDETALAYVKLALAEHLLTFAIDEQPEIVWHGDGAAGSPLPYFREMRVVRTSDVTPRMRRITLSGSDLQRFTSDGLHVRLLFPKRRDVLPSWPTTGPDGRPCWPNFEDRPEVRIYTIRAINVARGEVDIDFVMHAGENMPGARFAAEALPGDLVGITGPGGGGISTADWYLLAGDETALPAIARILEELPGGTKAVVRIEVANAQERQVLRSVADVDLQWLCRDSLSAGTEQPLVDAVRAVDMPRDGKSIFAWVGCERAAFRQIRKYLREECGLSRAEHLVVAYWRRGFSGDAARKDESRP
ncbi:siderophore-interacting protein [Manganibacter manganicus]|uniref:Phage tail protein n=1 Tax=Manganibacter manganicus TaxID=1873176 RepID=A0A1V8RMB9_9HYPH|nr:siderophore-interacting protein [Pseudaminobacter manganicus]OQM74337.1 phage tail protein [Pseudaminobacter manganicus]